MRNTYNPDARRHLWEYQETLTGEDGDPRGGSDITEKFDNLDELRDNMHHYLGPLNVPYSWNWFPVNEYDDPDATDTFQITIAMAYRTVSWTCPISRDQEPQARELLTECARYQQAIWAPIVGTPPTANPLKINS